MEYPCEACLFKGIENRSILGCTTCKASFCLECGKSHKGHDDKADHLVMLLALCKDKINQRKKPVESNVKPKTEEEGLSMKLGGSPEQYYYMHGNALKRENYAEGECLQGTKREERNSDLDGNLVGAGNVLSNDLIVEKQNENKNKENCNNDSGGDTGPGKTGYVAVNTWHRETDISDEQNNAAKHNNENRNQNIGHKNYKTSTEIDKGTLSNDKRDSGVRMRSNEQISEVSEKDKKEATDRIDNKHDSDTPYNDLEFESEAEISYDYSSLNDTDYECMENPIPTHDEKIHNYTCWSSRHCDCYLHKVKFNTDDDKKLGSNERIAELSENGNETIYDYVDNDEIEDLAFNNAQSPSSCCVDVETTETLLEGGNKTKETSGSELSLKSITCNNSLHGNISTVSDKSERHKIFRPPDKDKEQYWLLDKDREKPMLPYKDKGQRRLPEKDKEQYRLPEKNKDQLLLPEKDKEQCQLPERDKEQYRLPQKYKEQYWLPEKEKEKYRLPEKDKEQYRLSKEDKEQYQLLDKDKEQYQSHERDKAQRQLPKKNKKERRLPDEERESRDRLADNIFIVQVIQSPPEVGILSGDFYLQILPDGIKLLTKNKASGLFWPFNGIRRFGKQDNSGCFSIEAGRRCESGPGEFVFKSEFQHEIYEQVLKMSRNR